VWTHLNNNFFTGNFTSPPDDVSKKSIHYLDIITLKCHQFLQGESCPCDSFLSLIRTLNEIQFFTKSCCFGFQKLSHQSSLCGEEPCSFEPSGLEPATPHESLSRQSTAEYDPGYSARVDFALKLGYTEDLVQTALNKLGPNPSHNELLAVSNSAPTRAIMEY
jgi:hypothetical protein